MIKQFTIIITINQYFIFKYYLNYLKSQVQINFVNVMMARDSHLKIIIHY